MKILDKDFILFTKKDLIKILDKKFYLMFFSKDIINERIIKLSNIFISMWYNEAWYRKIEIGLCVFVYISHARIRTHTQTHTHTHTYKHTRTHTNTHEHIQTHTNTHTHTRTCFLCSEFAQWKQSLQCFDNHSLDNQSIAR